MVLGVYYLTLDSNSKHKGHGRVFADMLEVQMAYQLEQIHVHAKIKVRVNTWYDDEGNRLDEQEERIIDTTVGRVLFNLVLVPEIQFANDVFDKGAVKDLIGEVLELTDEETTTISFGSRLSRIFMILCFRVVPLTMLSSIITRLSSPRRSDP